MTTFAFAHLPVADHAATQNFEQIQRIVNEGEEPWVELSYGPKMESYAEGFQTPGSRVEESGAALRLRGIIKVKAGETLKLGETIFTLPEGSRPPGKVDLFCYGETGAATAGLIQIATTGVVTVVAWLSGTEAGAGKVLILDGLTFNLT